MQQSGGVRTETLHAKHYTLNPKYATTPSHTHYRRTAPARLQATQFRNKQRRPMVPLF